MACGGSEHCPGGEFPCDTVIVCDWFAFEALSAGGPDSDAFDFHAHGDAVTFRTEGGGMILDVGSYDATTGGGGYNVDTGGGGLIWDFGGGGWDIDTGNGGMTIDTGTGGFVANTISATKKFMDVFLGNGGVFTVHDHLGASIFEVRDDGSVHILTGTAVIADL